MKKRWQDIATLVLGLWLIVSPFILSRTMGDYVLLNNSMIVGVFIQMAAIAAIMRPNAWKEWILLVLGSWLIAASYFLGNGELFNGSLTTLAENQFIVGLLVMVDAAFGLYRRTAIRDMDKPMAA